MTEVSEDLGTLFILDNTSAGRLCLSRLSLSDLTDRSQRCATSSDLLGADPGKVQVNNFRIQSVSELAFEFSRNEPGSAVSPQTVVVDRRTLAMSAAQTGEVNPRSVQVPWSVQRTALLSAQAPRFSASMGRESLRIPLKAELVIDVYGRVRDLSLSGSTSEVLDSVRMALMTWSFKPTLLNGQPVEVITQLTAPASDLSAVK